LSAGLACTHVFAHYKTSNMGQTVPLTQNQKTKVNFDENVAKERDEDDLEVPLRKMMQCGRLQGIRKQNNLRIRTPREASGLLKSCSKEASNMLLRAAGIQSDKTSKSQDSNKLSCKISNGIKNSRRDDVPEKDIVDNPVSSDMEMSISTKRSKYAEYVLGSNLRRATGSGKSQNLKVSNPKV